MFDVAVEVGDVTGRKVAQRVVIGALQDHGEFVAAVTVHRQAAAGGDTQEHEMAIVHVERTYVMDARADQAPAQRAIRFTEIGPERLRQ